MEVSDLQSAIKEMEALWVRMLATKSTALGNGFSGVSHQPLVHIRQPESQNPLVGLCLQSFLSMPGFGPYTQRAIACGWTEGSCSLIHRGNRHKGAG